MHVVPAADLLERTGFERPDFRGIGVPVHFQHCDFLDCLRLASRQPIHLLHQESLESRNRLFDSQQTVRHGHSVFQHAIDRRIPLRQPLLECIGLLRSVGDESLKCVPLCLQLSLQKCQ